MFRIRRIYDNVLPINQTALREIDRILREHFPLAPPLEFSDLAAKMQRPFKYGFQTIIYVGENARGDIQGCAVVLRDTELKFHFLDYIATARSIRGRGIGAALYEFVRDEALSEMSKGMFFECLPDDAEDCPDPKLREQNAARLRFYEEFGARPIIGTGYETPLPGSTGGLMPHLVYDDLGAGQPLRRDFARKVVKAILERKYARLCPPSYNELVIQSFQDDPIRLRPFRYLKTEAPLRPAAQPRSERLAVVETDQHGIHHIRERGYVEAPVRIRSISTALRAAGWCDFVPPEEYALKHILAVHHRGLVAYLRRACQDVPEGKSLYPYVFPIRNATRPPRERSVLAGYYCIDTFTPVHRHAFQAARRAVECSLTAADEILRGRRFAYALVRPPGHHAESRVFGGFCYFNNAAVAAQYLIKFGRVAILDVDYHHGNGQQEIFYDRNDVLTISIHGDPAFAYPYFAGFADEKGRDAGEGFNLNITLPEVLDGAGYRKALERAIKRISTFKPDFLIVSLGLDTAKGDPTGTWHLRPKDFDANGRMLAELRLPTLVIQEGGYRTRTLGTNARSFFQGLLGVSRASGTGRPGQ